MSQIHMLITDSVPTNRERLKALADQAHRTDPEVVLNEITIGKEGKDGWRKAVHPFQSILYVSQEGDLDHFRLLHAVCKEENKVLLPAMCLHQTGMAGPIIRPESDGCWESAWRRVHGTAVHKEPEQHTFSTTAGAMLANVIVFELFKTVTGVPEQRNSFYLLDLETLEGSWHSFMPHPFVHGSEAVRSVELSALSFNVLNSGTDRNASNHLFNYLNRLTSAQSGILHAWEEGDLRQFPLSQCRVQAVDPLSEGPAGLLPEWVCAGLTHEEARREAGLLGIEAYVSRLAARLLHTDEVVGIGAGVSAAEGLLRGLQANLAEQHAMQHHFHTPSVTRVQLSRVEDDRCRFYLQALTTMRVVPVIGLGEEVSGFPSIWVRTGEEWFGSTDLNITMALQKSLKAALQKNQNHSAYRAAQVLEASSVELGKDTTVDMVVPSSEGTTHITALHEALQILEKNGKRLFVADLAVEPFLREELKGVFGVLVREGGSR